MAMRNPRGRVNYEPNSWGEGPREDPRKGFRSYPATADGPKVRLRPESFADHYSQARQFYISQTPVEQTHIAMALTFELSKVETPAIRERMVSHLLNIDQDLARTVATKLGLRDLPQPADAAVAPRTNLPASDALSIILNGPDSFAGRKIGVLVSDGIDAALLQGLEQAAMAEGAMVEIVAPRVGGIEAADGTLIPAKQMIDGGPSVLYDAVAIIVSPEGAAELEQEATARDFVADAFAHCKFIAHVDAAAPLFAKAGVKPDEGFVSIGGPDDFAGFVKTCRQLRLWPRESKVKLPA